MTSGRAKRRGGCDSADMAKRVPLVGDEKTSLHMSLDRHRDVVLWEARGTRRRAAPPAHDPVWDQPAGLGEAPRRRRVPVVLPDVRTCDGTARDRPGRRHARPHKTTADIVAFYDRARAASDQVIEELDLDALGTAWFGKQVSLRRVLIGMVEETARHAGHMDILRELLDGATGSHRPD